MNNFEDRKSNKPYRRKIAILDDNGNQTSTQLVDIERCDEEDVTNPGTRLNEDNLNKLISFEKSPIIDIPNTNPTKLARLVIDANDKAYICPPNNGAVISLNVPAGGTTGQVLTKVDDSNFNAQWCNPTGSGGGTTAASYIYECNGVNDNEILSQMVSDFLEDYGSANKTLYVKGIGVFGAGGLVAKGDPINIADETRDEIEMYKGNIRNNLFAYRYWFEFGILDNTPNLYEYYPDGFEATWQNMVNAILVYTSNIETDEDRWGDYFGASDALRNEINLMLDKLESDVIGTLPEKANSSIGSINDLTDKIYNDYNSIPDALIRLQEAEENQSVRYADDDSLVYLKVLNHEFSGKRIVLDMDAVDFTQAIYHVPEDCPSLPLSFARLNNCEFKGNVRFQPEYTRGVIGLRGDNNIIRGNWDIFSSGRCVGVSGGNNNIVKGNWKLISEEGDCIGFAGGSENTAKGNWKLHSYNNTCYAVHNSYGTHNLKGNWSLDGVKAYGTIGTSEYFGLNIKDGTWNITGHSYDENSAVLIYGIGQYNVDNLTINMYVPMGASTAAVYSYNACDPQEDGDPNASPLISYNNFYAVNNCYFFHSYTYGVGAYTGEISVVRGIYITGSRMIVTNCRFYEAIKGNIIPTVVMPGGDDLSDYVVYANNIKLSFLHPFIEEDGDIGGF